MTKRSIAKIAVPGITPGPVDGGEPIFEWIDPRKLLVDETYQRNLSERSITLIRKIVGNWSWTKFKPPIVVQTDEGLEVVDGQHTAIGAATHPAINKIPVMVVEADSLQARAEAFLGHNADRIAVTPLQMHHAAVLAGDETHMTIRQVCDRAGVRIPKNLPGGANFKPGDCVSVSTIKTLVNARGAMGARKVLEVSAQARSAPVSAAEIRAVDLLLHDPEYAGRVEAPDITTALIGLGPRAEQMAKAYAANHGTRLWQAMAVIIWRRCDGEHRRAD